MTRPVTYLIRMAIFLALVLLACGVLSPVLWGIFWNNPGLNALILAVLLIGIVWNLFQVIRLRREVDWVQHFQDGDHLNAPPEARLLAPMARMMHARQASGGDGRLTLSAGAARTLLDSLASRLDESRELSRYMTGLLIFLGLLGTFWGLLRTVGGVADVIGGMSVGGNDVTALFDQLKNGLARPLAGMSTAFSASLFGLAGALVLGFLDLTAGQAQNRFFNELEEWLAGLTRLSSGALADGDTTVPVYVQALLEQTAENMESLRRVLLRGEEDQSRARQAMVTLNERIATLADAVRSGQQQAQRLAEASAADAEAARAHLRAIELSLERIATQSDQGRTEAGQDLRSDLRVLTRAVAMLAEQRRS